MMPKFGFASLSVSLSSVLQYDKIDRFTIVDRDRFTCKSATSKAASKMFVKLTPILGCLKRSALE